MMKSQISDDLLFKMARANDIEEFVILKDLAGLHGKKLNQHHTLEFLMMAAAQHMKKPAVALALLKDCKHITVGSWLLSMLVQWNEENSLQPYINKNLQMLVNEVRMWFPLG